MCISVPKDDMRHHYEYKVEQSQFEKENKESLQIVCSVFTTCEASKNFIIQSIFSYYLLFLPAGTYGSRKAKLYSLVVSGSKVSGSMLDKDKNTDTNTGNNTLKIENRLVCYTKQLIGL